MQPILLPDRRDRLIRLCGMLGSAHDGERANAARMADKLVREAGLTWHNVIATPPPAQPTARAWRPAPPAPAAPPSYPAPGIGHADVARGILARRRAWLTAWEAGFLESLTTRRTLSDKQRTALAAIAAKIELRERSAS